MSLWGWRPATTIVVRWVVERQTTPAPKVAAHFPETDLYHHQPGSGSASSLDCHALSRLFIWRRLGFWLVLAVSRSTPFLCSAVL